VSSPIPTKSRQAVRARDRQRCVRCAGNGTEWHHRRSRSVRDPHTHCTCNGVLLCSTCHRWVHSHPFEARAVGLIVSRYREPSKMQVEHALLGWVWLTCEARWAAAPSYEQEAEREAEQ
jgi:5-methylcytosine-specific restriction protein A